MEEKEVKVQLTKAMFTRLLKEMSNDSEPNKFQQKDEYFDTELMMINNLNRGLRLRSFNEKPFAIEFKSLFFNKYKKGTNPWFIEEISLELPLDTKSILALNKILRRLGLQEIRSKNSYSTKELMEELSRIGLSPKISVTKDRTVFEIQDIEYVFDYIEELGYFLEIESKGEIDPLDELKRIIDDKEYPIIRNGYNDMVARNINNCIPNTTKQLLFKVNPSWNILLTEADMVDNFLSKDNR